MKTADFFTAKFIKDDAMGRRVERVFWAWNHPDKNDWEAADQLLGCTTGSRGLSTRSISPAMS